MESSGDQCWGSFSKNVELWLLRVGSHLGACRGALWVLGGRHTDTCCHQQSLKVSGANAAQLPPLGWVYRGWGGSSIGLLGVLARLLLGVRRFGLLAGQEGAAGLSVSRVLRGKDQQEETGRNAEKR